MKAHTNEFKETIKTFGRELDSKITYTIDGSEYELGNEDLNSVTPHYQSAILKSTMRELDLEVKENTNLFNINGEVSTSVALEKYNNGFTLTKGTNRVVRINLPKTYEAGTYTLNFDLINSNLTNNNRFAINIQYNSNTLISSFPLVNKTFTSPSEFNQLYFYINNSEPDTATITIDNIMLTKSDFPQPFERYNKLIESDAKGTILNYKFGVKVEDNYHYVDYGNYVVKDIEKQEDTNSYKIMCYDKMLYSMVDYVNLNVTYPITIRNYLNAICNYLGLTFKNANDTFANYNKQIANELYLDSDGKSLGYKFRDVLDELAQVTASTICINEEDDELEIRYINQTVGKNLLNPNRIQQKTNNGITCSFDKETQIITFDGTATQDNTTFQFTNSGLDISEVISGLTTLTAYYVSGSVTTYFQWRINNSDWSTSKSYNLLNIADNKIISNTLNVSFELANSSFSFRFNEGSVADNLKIKIMVANDLDTTYEPYGDTINEEFLKDVNVNFGEKYGPINTIVLSRSAGADNIYYPSTLPENPIEIKISDNQIMNGNNRADFMQEIYNKLNGLEYYINDYASPGICYYNVCDRYNVMIGDTFYSCVMFNDEVNVTQGLEENIYTDLPEESVTDYTKADKDDRKLNQTILMVDKQNGIIQSLVEKVVDISNTITGNVSIQLENAHLGGLHKLVIYGDVRPTFPSSDLYPSSTTYTRDTYLLIDDKEYKLDFDILRYYSLEKHDEFVYEDGECKIIRRVGVNSGGQMYPLTNDVIEEREGVFLEVNSNSTIKLKSFDNAFYTATYLLENEYTDNFASQVDVNSKITQTADSINLEVNKKLDSEDFNGANILLEVNKDGSQAKINADKIALEGYTTINGNFKVDESGNMEAKNATVDNINIINTDSQIVMYESGSETFGTAKLKFFKDNLNYSYFKYSQILLRYNDDRYINIQNSLSPMIEVSKGSDSSTVWADEMVSPSFRQTSRYEEKKNFEKLKSGIDIIKSIDIYKYHLKNQDETTKKHIGFVIGDNYNYSEEVTSKNNDGVELYSFISVCCKAIQEQQEEIENLKKEMEELKNAKD